MTTTSNTSEDSSRVRKIVVLGGGTAGFLTAIALNRSLPEVEVVIVRSTKIGVVGVGEGTIPSVVHFLHHFLGLGRFDIYREVKASPKLGIRYLWGKRPFFNYTFTGQLVAPHRQMKRPRGYYCDQEFNFADINSALMNNDRVCVRQPDGTPRFNANVAYHLENKNFVGFLEKMADREGIRKIDDIVDDVVQSEAGVSALKLSQEGELRADFFVDCSGFRSEIIGKALQEPKIDFSDALFCDRAVVGGWKRTDETYLPYTTAETMNAGWCWRIEHDELINRGYVYCSNFLSEDQAIAEYKSKNPRVGDCRVIKFSSGIVRRSWVKNVVAIGNSAGFVEPLEATSIGMICDAALRLSTALSASNGRILDRQKTIFNRITLKNWTIIRDFLALHYKFNDRLDTPFWNAAMNEVSIGDAQEYVNYFRDVGPDFSILGTELKRDFFTAEGYLVMMVGQQVPYARNFEIEAGERKTWNNFKATLDRVAGKGFNVEDFLAIARSDNAAQKFGISEDAPMRKKNAIVGNSVQAGQLQWH